ALDSRPVAPKLGEGGKYPMLAVAGIAHPLAGGLDIGLAACAIIPPRADRGIAMGTGGHDSEAALVTREGLARGQAEQDRPDEMSLQARVANGVHVGSSS